MTDLDPTGTSATFHDVHRVLADHDISVASYLSRTAPLGALCEVWIDQLLAGERRRAVALVEEALAEGTSLEDLYLHVFGPALREIGRRWQHREITVAQEHLATGITQYAMSVLYPRVMAGDRAGGLLVAACVAGELHEVGLRMVADVFELRGWRSRFFGASVPKTDVLAAVAELQPDVVALSVTMAEHLDDLTDLVAGIRDSSDAEILVGGRLFSIVPELWHRVGADGTADDAPSAVAWAEERRRAA